MNVNIHAGRRAVPDTGAVLRHIVNITTTSGVIMKIDATNNQVVSEIKKTISVIARIALEDLADDVRIREELGIDSLMSIEIIAKIEKRYGININEEEIMKISRVGEFVEHIASKIAMA